MTSKSYAFICGTARSGTSELWRLVSAHPKAAIGVERYINRAVTGRFELDTRLFEHERFFRIEDGDTFYDNLDWCGAYYPRLEKRFDDCVLFGDKIPRLYQQYDQVNKVFSKPKILFILRNIFDVASSYNQRAMEGKNWRAERDYAVAVTDWNESLSSTLAHFDNSEIFVLEYETLFYEGAAIAPVFEFLGLDLDPAVIQCYRLQLIKAGELQSKRKDGLTPLQKHYICQNASFSEYQRLLELASEQGRLLLPEPDQRKMAAVTAGMPGKYQQADFEIIDYAYQPLPGAGVLVRGPVPKDLDKGGYLACVGGAQTLGRFIEAPYPQLLGEALGREVLNLGHGGGKPLYFSQPEIIEYLNRADLAVIQVMTARSVGNAYFEPASIKNSFLRERGASPQSESKFADHAYGELLKEKPREWIIELIEETRANWLREMRALLQAVRVPTILFWFSDRQPEYQPGFESAQELMGDYPHFINREMIEELQTSADLYVEYVGNTGLPQPLRSRFDGSPVALFPRKPCPSDNTYYPSPQMHAEAASALLEAIRDSAKFAEIEHTGS